jgi:hypothetical protein
LIEELRILQDVPSFVYSHQYGVGNVGTAIRESFAVPFGREFNPLLWGK